MVHVVPEVDFKDALHEGLREAIRNRSAEACYDDCAVIKAYTGSRGQASGASLAFVRFLAGFLARPLCSAPGFWGCWALSGLRGLRTHDFGVEGFSQTIRRKLQRRGVVKGCLVALQLLLVESQLLT